MEAAETTTSRVRLPDRLPWSVPEFASPCGLSAQSVRPAMDRGDLHHLRVGGRLLIPRDQALRFLDGATTPPLSQEMDAC